MDRLPVFAEQLRFIERQGLITGYAGAWPLPGNRSRWFIPLMQALG
jgi:hypothetical protein